jgi:hypothetical protein
MVMSMFVDEDLERMCDSQFWGTERLSARMSEENQ